jgi:electron transport complex protein RnfG
MKKALTSGLVLLILGVVCGAVLGVVNYFTAPIIEARIQAEKYAALEEVGITIADYTITETADVTDQIDKTIFLKQGSVLKYAAYSVTTNGYSSGLNLLIIVDENLTVVGYKVIAHSETPGVGETALATHDYNMVGAVLPDITGFDAVSAPTAPLTNAGVLRCFTLVAAQAAIDFGGAD